MSEIIKLLRIKHYIKNFFIVIPLFFSGEFSQLDKLLNTTIVFIAFCLVASAVYILNDYLDIENDKLHETKKYRPLAAGTVSTEQAFTVFAFFLLIAGVLVLMVNMTAALLLLAYFAMNVAYSFHLKNFPLVDINIIAIGFVIRLFVGAVASQIELSQWIVIMTFLLALFLGLAKRRDDVLIFEETGVKARQKIDQYTRQFLDQSLSLLGGVAIVAYLMYVTSPQTIERMASDYLYLNSIFVITGILRYLYRTLVLNDSSSPTRALYTDRVLQLMIVGWVVSFAWVLYF